MAGAGEGLVVPVEVAGRGMEVGTNGRNGERSVGR